MGDQWIKLEFDAGPAPDPDAILVAERFRAMVLLLASVDKKSWQVEQPRYRWELVAASKNSPAMLEIRGRSVAESEGDVVGKVMDGLRRLQIAPDPSLLDTTFSRDDLKMISVMTRPRKGSPRVGVAIYYDDVSRPTVFRPTRKLGENARALRRHRSPVSERYVVIEGLLRTITADSRENIFEHHLLVVPSDDQRPVRCVFNPRDAAVLGGHVGHNIFVEGWLRGDQSQQVMHVTAFVLKPKVPMSLAQIRAARIRVPGDLSPHEYIQRLRAEGE